MLNVPIDNTEKFILSDYYDDYSTNEGRNNNGKIQ